VAPGNFWDIIPQRNQHPATAVKLLDKGVEMSNLSSKFQLGIVDVPRGVGIADEVGGDFGWEARMPEEGFEGGAMHRRQPATPPIPNLEASCGPRPIGWLGTISAMEVGWDTRSRARCSKSVSWSRISLVSVTRF